MIYPTYTVAGVDLTDPSGRWELVPGTEFLPRFPGARASTWNVPGMPGSMSAIYAPPEPTTVSLKLRINAVAGTANTIVSGGRAARVKAIQDNLDLLYYAIAAARQSYHGLIAVNRYTKAGEYRTAKARMISASDLDFDMSKEYATLTMIFSIPSGVWLAPSFDVTTATINKANSQIRIKVPAGTAPSVESMVCFLPPGGASMESKYGNRIRVTGGQHGGFLLGTKDQSVTLPAGKWTMVNTLHWKYGFASRSNDWGIPKPYKGLIEPSARPMGSALTLLPSAERGWAYVYITVPKAGTKVILRTRKAYY